MLFREWLCHSSQPNRGKTWSNYYRLVTDEKKYRHHKIRQHDIGLLISFDNDIICQTMTLTRLNVMITIAYLSHLWKLERESRREPDFLFNNGRKMTCLVIFGALGRSCSVPNKIHFIFMTLPVCFRAYQKRA